MKDDWTRGLRLARSTSSPAHWVTSCYVEFKEPIGVVPRPARIATRVVHAGVTGVMEDSES
jgi:hypothetical protein